MLIGMALGVLTVTFLGFDIWPTCVGRNVSDDGELPGGSEGTLEPMSFTAPALGSLSSATIKVAMLRLGRTGVKVRFTVQGAPAPRSGVQSLLEIRKPRLSGLTWNFNPVIAGPLFKIV